MFKITPSKTAVIITALINSASFPALADPIIAKHGNAAQTEFDITKTEIITMGATIVFKIAVSGHAGASKPAATGRLAGSSVYSYVWPTNLNSAAVGFEADQGILALAVTSHPDFDDTPAVDENSDGNKANDGNLWHSHWVVLEPDDACGKGSLKVKTFQPAPSQNCQQTGPAFLCSLIAPNFYQNYLGRWSL